MALPEGKSVEEILAEAQRWYNENTGAKHTPTPVLRAGSPKEVRPSAPAAKVETPREFAADLIHDVATINDEMGETVKKVSRKIVRTAKLNVKKTAPIHSSGAERHIDFEFEKGKFGPASVIGYDHHGAGRLGILLEFGGGGDHSPAHWDIKLALDAHEDDFWDAIGNDGEFTLQNRFGASGMKYRPR